MVHKIFVVWKKKTLSVLVYHGLEATDKNDWPAEITSLEKGRINKMYIIILLHFSDDVQIGVTKFKNGSDLWKGLETLYQVKDVFNKLLMVH